MPYVATYLDEISANYTAVTRADFNSNLITVFSFSVRPVGVWLVPTNPFAPSEQKVLIPMGISLNTFVVGDSVTSSTTLRYVPLGSIGPEKQLHFTYKKKPKIFFYCVNQPLWRIKYLAL